MELFESTITTSGELEQQYFIELALDLLLFLCLHIIFVVVNIYKVF